MTRPTLRHGLPYRWWATDAGTAVLVVVMLTALGLALLGGWTRWWG